MTQINKKRELQLILKRAGGSLIPGRCAAVFTRHRGAPRAATRLINRITGKPAPSRFIREHDSLYRKRLIDWLSSHSDKVQVFGDGPFVVSVVGV